jgi:spermidine/putrescine-binding protein
LKIYKKVVSKDTVNTMANESFKDNVNVLNDEEDSGVDLARMLKKAKNKAKAKNKKVEEKLKELMDANSDATEAGRSILEGNS